MASVRRSLPFLVLALAVGAVVATVRAWTDARGGSRAVGRAAECYYDGAPQRDCPTPRRMHGRSFGLLYSVRAVAPCWYLCLDLKIPTRSRTRSRCTHP